MLLISCGNNELAGGWDEQIQICPCLLLRVTSFSLAETKNNQYFGLALEQRFFGFFFFLSFFKLKFIYTVALISAEQQSDLVIHIYTFF